MRRRNFLSTSLAALPALSYARPGWMPSGGLSLLRDLPEGSGDRVLVVVGLGGGNDGLNTVIPLEGYDNLARHRESVLLPRRSLLAVEPTFAFHPAMAGARGLYDDGALGVVHSVGYPGANRSHFRSADIYRSGSPAEELWSSGWLGRRYQQVHPAYPVGYPLAGDEDPISVTVARTPTANCESDGANFSFPVFDPGNAQELLELAGPQSPGSRFGEELDFTRLTIRQSNAYGAAVDAKFRRGRNLATYPDTELGQRLSQVARMISGGLATSMYYVPQPGGYDTHDNQVEAGDHTLGTHATLLRDLTEAVAAFQLDLEMLGLAQRVLGVTYSEFGRQIGSNASGGTDHGEAGPLLLFGAAVEPGALGSAPEIPAEVDRGDALPMQYDFRDVYATLLTDWFGSPVSDVDEAFARTHTWLPLVRESARAEYDHLRARRPDAQAPDKGGDGEQTPAEGDAPPAGEGTSGVGGYPDRAAALALSASPNPFHARTRLTFAVERPGRVRLVAYDGRGAELETLFDRRLPAGEHSVRVDASAYPEGRVAFRLQAGYRVGVCAAAKV